MNALKKKRIKSVMKYTWPFYLLAALIIIPSMYFIFGVTHRTPAYKTMTIFVTGEMKDNKKCRNDLIEKYKSNELKSVSFVSAIPGTANYNQKLTVPGYNTCDILIIPESKLNDVVVSAFALNLSDELINEYYQGYTFYQQEDVNYGIKIDRNKVSDYFYLPSEECYLVLNGKSVNTGKYSTKEIKEHDTALRIVQDWGM